MTESNEVVILLPGKISGNSLILAETSRSQVSINKDLVPSLILKVWWNDKIIVTENHPMIPRNKFPGDTYQIPDRTRVCWYLVDLGNDDVRRFEDYELLSEHTKTLTVDPSQINLMNLRDAQRLREKELGFKFTADSVNRFLRTRNTSSQ